MLDLIFGMAEWHATAKLRMHTDRTLSRLRAATSYLGAKLRYFVRHVTPHYKTKELPRKEAARTRRKQRAQPAASPRVQPDHAQSKSGPLPNAKVKLLSLLTYKLHALGDYVAQILHFGTTDSYSTQPV